jgi:hypothetical protein
LSELSRRATGANCLRRRHSIDEHQHAAIARGLKNQ